MLAIPGHVASEMPPHFLIISNIISISLGPSNTGLEYNSSAKMAPADHISEANP